MFPLPSSILPSVTVPVGACEQSNCEFSSKLLCRFSHIFLSCLPLFRDHGTFGESATSFIQTSIKTLIILRVNKRFWGKLSTPDLFKDIMLIAAIFLVGQF